VDQKTQDLLMLAVIGLIAGWLASWILGTGGLISYLISGVLGAFVGTWLLNATGINLGIQNHFARQVATATIGAAVVVILARIIS
jgi:uncharacterized membrane protein YeaQ/YmgE (transglycosylase-associated protein family)